MFYNKFVDHTHIHTHTYLKCLVYYKIEKNLSCRFLLIHFLFSKPLLRCKSFKIKKKNNFLVDVMNKDFTVLPHTTHTRLLYIYIYI